LQHDGHQRDGGNESRLRRAPHWSVLCAFCSQIELISILYLCLTVCPKRRGALFIYYQVCWEIELVWGVCWDLVSGTHEGMQNSIDIISVRN
jgi:hypothetical protein